MSKKLDPRFRGVNLMLGALMLSAVASCGPSPSPVVAGNAPAYGMTLGNARRALYENEAIPAAPEIEWDVNAGSGIRGTLVLLDSTVLVATTNRQMLAFHRRSGRKHWDQRFNNGVMSTALYDQNTVFVATDEYDGSVFALRTERGRRKWKRTVGPVRFTPLLDNSVLYLGTDRGLVSAMSTDEGTQLWRAGFRAPIAESPLDAGDRIIVFTASDSVFAMRKSDGAITARGSTRSSPSAPPAASGNTIIVAMQDSSVVGYDARNLSETWRVKTSSPVLTAPVVTETGEAYVVSRDGVVYRIREGRAETLASLGHAVSASLTLARGHLLIGSYDGTLLAVTTADGTVVWQQRFNDSIIAPVAVGGQAVYVPLMRGRIVKLR